MFRLQVTLRRDDGLRVPVALSPYPMSVVRCCCDGRWAEAQRLCSGVGAPALWLVLAAMAVHFKRLEAARVAYAALIEPERVLLVDRIARNRVRPFLFFQMMTEVDRVDD